MEIITTILCSIIGALVGATFALLFFCIKDNPKKTKDLMFKIKCYYKYWLMRKVYRDEGEYLGRIILKRAEVKIVANHLFFRNCVKIVVQYRLCRESNSKMYVFGFTMSEFIKLLRKLEQNKKDNVKAWEKETLYTVIKKEGYEHRKYRPRTYKI